MTARPVRWPPDLASEPAASRLRTVLWVLALVAIAFWDLDGRSIHHRDLPRFAVIAREMIQGGDWLVPHQHGLSYANKPILYIWMVAAPSALAGDATALLLRLPSALALVATALATAVWGRARTGSVAVGRLAGLLVATTALTNELGRVGRPDMLAAAFSTIAATLLDRAALGKGRPRDAWLAGLALGGGLLSKGPVVFLVPLLVLLLPTPGTGVRERFARARPVLALGVSLGVAALWLVPVWLREGGPFIQRLVVDQVGNRVAGAANHVEGPLYYLIELPAVLLLWAPLTLGACIATAFPRWRAAFGGVTLPLVVGSTVAILSLVPTKEVRYAAVIVAPLSIVGAAAAVALARRTLAASNARRHLLVTGALAILLALAAVVLMVRWPSTVAWALPVAICLLATGVLAIRARTAGEPPGAVAGRVLGVVAVTIGCASCLQWVVFARYLEVKAAAENRAVAAVLPDAVPVAVLLGDGLEPDDLYESVRRPIALHDPSHVPSREERPRLIVATDAERLPALEAARGELARVLLRVERPKNRTLVVAEFGR